MMDEIEQEPVTTVGEQLRAAREAQGLSIEDVAASTRIPTRHLASLEMSDWSALPAPTYSMGFAKNYATAVGLDRDAIGEQLRTEMGGTRPTYQQPSEVFEPADPKRVMPMSLVIGAILALAIVALGLTWLQNRELSDDGNAPAAPVASAPAAATPAAPAAISAAPVVITANEAAWIEVRDGATILKQGELGAGQSFEVPATATAPVLTTAKPEALRISVGTADAPAIGPAGKRVSGVSLKGDDLLKGPAASTPAPIPAAATPATPARRIRSTETRAAPAPAVVAPAPEAVSNATTNAAD
jgi:cytoskeletal protein RodZ